MATASGKRRARTAAPPATVRAAAAWAGGFYLNQAAFGHLKERGGRIVNFASAAGVQGYPGKAAYAAAKGAVVAWTRSAAVKWGRYGITVNAIAPAIWTPTYTRPVRR
ncbi:SDR family NAD(P)-dependent oxidoreductase [Streptomyces sp. NBC_00554]|uniref:SDR family NAD(P)-dependent oxidoreductase n=1 Tax=unclassified Streptomyces TaxID=2593676 RepID=UPI00325167F9|nr:SDR family NAD(P)-dependent oxidoreductase [Streptomyces sp. NBC_00554]